MDRSLSPEEEQRRRRAYEQSNTNKEALEILDNLTWGAFDWWRKSRGLPSLAGEKGLAAKEDQRRFEVWKRVSSDGEGAKELGITKSAFRQWRYGRSLDIPSTEEGEEEGQRLPLTEERKQYLWEFIACCVYGVDYESNRGLGDE